MTVAGATSSLCVAPGFARGFLDWQGGAKRAEPQRAICLAHESRIHVLFNPSRCSQSRSIHQEGILAKRVPHVQGVFSDSRLQSSASCSQGHCRRLETGESPSGPQGTVGLTRRARGGLRAKCREVFVRPALWARVLWRVGRHIQRTPRTACK